jgi:hypothetical protein
VYFGLFHGACPERKHETYNDGVRKRNNSVDCDAFRPFMRQLIFIRKSSVANFQLKKGTLSFTEQPKLKKFNQIKHQKNNELSFVYKWTGGRVLFTRPRVHFVHQLLIVNWLR